MTLCALSMLECPCSRAPSLDYTPYPFVLGRLQPRYYVALSIECLHYVMATETLHNFAFL